MATTKNLFILGVLFVSCSTIGASGRSLLDNGSAGGIFDITKFGAVADGKTNNVEVS